MSYGGIRDPSTGAYDVLGFVDVNRRPCYTWQAYVIGARASDRDGTIYIGGDERISKFFSIHGNEVRMTRL
jgi:hypothetical protein